MRRLGFPALCLFALAGLLAALTGGFRAESEAPARTVKPFSLEDTSGKTWKLADLKEKKAVVVVFVGTECPVNNASMPVLAGLHTRYSPQGVQFLAVASNCLDTPAKLLAFSRAHKLPFPLLRDPANVVADDFGARRTPEAFVLSPQGKVLYRGRIDDQFGIGYKRKEPTRKDLALALDEVLAGKPVSVPVTEVSGCLISRVSKPKAEGTVTYSKEVSRILQKSCQECHRPGQVGPMPLLSYEDALAWSGMIREVVSDGRMPPWHADPRHGKFANDRSLAPEDRKALLSWIEQGCPKGDPRDEPPAKTFVKGWTIGKPDVVYEFPDEVTVPAEAGPRGIPYKYVVVKTDLKEDRWVVAAEARPGAREVVHHIIVYVVDPAKGLKRDRRDGIGDGFLAAYAPGDMPLMLAPGQAKKVPKGAVLAFQMHYTPDGVQRKDRSSVGLVFAKEPPRSEVRTRSIAQRAIFIPPGAKSHEVRSQSTFDRDVELISLLPHMHLRGKDFKYEAVFPDGKREVLLSVPRYDFNWQSNYRLAKPLLLPAGSRIECTAHFDNSADNPNNPNPKELVRWGDQTWQEMMIGFVDYAFVEKKE